MPLTAVLRFKVRNPDGLFSWEPRRFTLLPPEPKSERLMQSLRLQSVDPDSLGDLEVYDVSGAKFAKCWSMEGGPGFDLVFPLTDAWSFLCPDPKVCIQWTRAINDALRLVRELDAQAEEETAGGIPSARSAPAVLEAHALQRQEEAADSGETSLAADTSVPDSLAGNQEHPPRNQRPETESLQELSRMTSELLQKHMGNGMPPRPPQNQFPHRQFQAQNTTLSTISPTESSPELHAVKLGAAEDGDRIAGQLRIPPIRGLGVAVHGSGSDRAPDLPSAVRGSSKDREPATAEPQTAPTDLNGYPADGVISGDMSGDFPGNDESRQDTPFPMLQREPADASGPAEVSSVGHASATRESREYSADLKDLLDALVKERRAIEAAAKCLTQTSTADARDRTLEQIPRQPAAPGRPLQSSAPQAQAWHLGAAEASSASDKDLSSLLLPAMSQKCSMLEEALRKASERAAVAEARCLQLESESRCGVGELRMAQEAAERAIKAREEAIMDRKKGEQKLKEALEAANREMLRIRSQERERHGLEVEKLSAGYDAERRRFAEAVAGEKERRQLAEERAHREIKQAQAEVQSSGDHLRRLKSDLESLQAKHAFLGEQHAKMLVENQELSTKVDQFELGALAREREAALEARRQESEKFQTGVQAAIEEGKLLAQQGFASRLRKAKLQAERDTREKVDAEWQEVVEGLKSDVHQLSNALKQQAAEHEGRMMTLQQKRDEREKDLHLRLADESKKLAVTQEALRNCDMARNVDHSEAEAKASQDRHALAETLAEVQRLRSSVGMALRQRDEERRVHAALEAEVEQLRMERRLENAELLELRTTLARIAAEKDHEGRSHVQAVARYEAVEASLQIARQEVAMLEQEIERITASRDQVQQTNRRLEKLVYGKQIQPGGPGSSRKDGPGRPRSASRQQDTPSRLNHSSISLPQPSPQRVGKPIALKASPAVRAAAQPRGKMGDGSGKRTPRGRGSLRDPSKRNRSASRA